MNVFIHPHFDDRYRDHPLVLADVGARGGLKKNWQVARPHLRVLGFEPDVQEYTRLVTANPPQPGGDLLFNVALHNQPGTIRLHVARDAGLSSIFEPNGDFLRAFPDVGRFDILDRRDVATDTLDHVVASHGIKGLDFIKVDTQGSELRVLEGAARNLADSVIGVEAEVEFAPIYTDQPLFADVDRYMRGLGFQLFDLRPCYWKREGGRTAGGPYGQIIWGDALYLKSIPALRQLLAALNPAERKGKLLKAMSVALLYGYADYALEMARPAEALAKAGDQADLFTAEERGLIATALGSDGSSPADTKVPGRRQLASALNKLATAVREPNDAWSISDRDLGNPPR
jgi:FkbM family methyltransferase